MRIVILAILALVLLAGCPPPQVQYPSGITGVVCTSCYAANRCDPALLPDGQVDAAVGLVASTLVGDGKVSAAAAAQAVRGLYVCVAGTAGLQAVPGGGWASGPCTTPAVKGSCLAGQYQDVTVLITVRDPKGRLLKTWETALAHETAHYFGVADGSAYLGDVVGRVNAELQRRFP